MGTPPHPQAPTDPGAPPIPPKNPPPQPCGEEQPLEPVDEPQPEDL